MMIACSFFDSDCRLKATNSTTRDGPRDGGGCPLLVTAEDAELVRKIRRILRTGKNAEIRRDTKGRPKVFRVSREIEQ